MVERQPGRPSEEEFIGAALRFLHDDYTAEYLHVSASYTGRVYVYYPGKAMDIETIHKEYFAEGITGDRESIRDFALRQLAAYQRLRKT
ncbi:hypothetical protein RAAC3_TM7C00001G0812 [Candidatus Saccharibacteria bacterium RAAC3_TM7_1]|nr:hypothetical protein RAAC3_TM7C00001G0812 [Candidatus Saccharibacteria bacterium RAAC3_TM7_1]